MHWAQWVANLYTMSQVKHTTITDKQELEEQIMISWRSECRHGDYLRVN